jgi:lipopolysaccharide export system protein LptA
VFKVSVIAAVIGLAALPFPAGAQTNIRLGGVSADPTAPVEVSADNLSVDQDSGKAVYSGNVKIGQGDLRLSAGQVEVIYTETSGTIATLRASDGVTFATATEAAEAASADYDLENGTLTLIGNVLLTQGASAISADRMVISLKDGLAQMSGNVRTVFQQDGN